MNNGKKLDLVRGLGKWSSAAIVVGTMVGTGIFLKPAEMAADAGSLFIVLAAWNRRFCLLYTSDAADDMQCVDLGGRRIIK